MTTTIQQTAKVYKLIILCGVLAMLLGVFCVFTTPWTTAGGIITALGLTSYITGKALRWWHHE